MDGIGDALRYGIPEFGLEVTGRGLLATDASGTISRPRVFAAGDIVTGPRTVVEAVVRHGGRRGARRVHRVGAAEAARPTHSAAFLAAASYA